MKWSQEEVEILKDNIFLNYDELSILLNRNKKHIASKIRRLDIADEYMKHNRFFGKHSDPIREKERSDKISKTCKKNKKSGGIRKGSGRGKKGTYKGYWCDSSYELAWVIYNLEFNVKFERNLEKFKYYYNEIEKYFIPDFVIDGEYFEIKGYEDPKLEFKLKYFPHKIKVLYESDMKYIFDYVREKYGKNFISLYEDRKYKSCSICSGYICKKNDSGVCISCLNKIKKENKKIQKNRKKYKRVEKYKNCNCGNLIKFESNMCVDCYNLKQRKVKIRPSIEQLMLDIDELGYSGTGRKYGVSDNAIRKWIKRKV